MPRSDHSGDACHVTEPRALGCTSLSVAPVVTFSVAMRSTRRPPTTVHCGAACTVTWAKPAAVVWTPPARVVGCCTPFTKRVSLVVPSTRLPSPPATSVDRPHTRSQSALPPADSLGTRWRCVRLSVARPAATAVNDWS